MWRTIFAGELPYPPPEMITVPLDGKGRIACDLYCRHCRYNLRGLGPELENALCPECGYPVRASIDQYKRFWMDEGWVREQIRGLFCAYAMLMVFIVTGFCAGLMSHVKGNAGWWVLLLGTTAIVGLFLLRRYWVSRPVTYGVAPAWHVPGRVRQRLMEGVPFVLASILGMVAIMSDGGGKGWVLPVMLWGAWAVGVTWQQLAIVRDLFAAHWALVARPSPVGARLAYVPMTLMLLASPVVLQLMKPIPDEHDALWIVRLFIMGSWTVVLLTPVMNMARLSGPVTEMYEEAVWTRVRARQAGTLPGGIGVQWEEFGLWQRWTAHGFERKLARRRNISKGRYKDGDAVL